MIGFELFCFKYNLILLVEAVSHSVFTGFTEKKKSSMLKKINFEHGMIVGATLGYIENGQKKR